MGYIGQWRHISRASLREDNGTRLATLCVVLIAREVADEYPQPKDDLWRLQLSVDCKITGPSYFTRGGIIIFTKKNHEAWQPASFFARRISKYPGHWFDQ